ncbi:hypothetical protein ACP275_14G210500 [Erythranthe tilingii]
MVKKIPARFNRFAAVFDDAAARAAGSWESSGSEHSSAADLSDLVNSFLERESREERESEELVDNGDQDKDEDDEIDFEYRDRLKDLLYRENDAVKGSIHAAVEKAYGEVDGSSSSGTSSPDFKRQLMARLRSRGFDAGLCKSKWEKSGRCLAGNYEYIDLIAGGSRYIVQVLLDGEFTIARPSGGYASLLEILPPVFVGKPEELKQVVRLMCTAVRKSMTIAGIHLPPWRRHDYIQNKWFGSYKRTTNEILSRKAALSYGCGGSSENQTLKRILFNRREDFVAKSGVGIRNLAAAVVLKQKENGAVNMCATIVVR